MQNSEYEEYTKGPKRMPTKANDGFGVYPTGNMTSPSNISPQTPQPVWKDTMQNIWGKTKEFIPKYVDALNNNGMFNNNTNFSPYTPKTYPMLNDNTYLQNQNFSTYNVKSTRDLIKDSTNNIENILKQPKINYNDINSVRTMAINSIGGLCNDCDSVVEQRRNQPSIPTWESAQQGKVIDEKRQSTMDNAVNGIIMLNLMDNALDNNFKTVNQTDPYYAQRLQEHTRE